MHLREHHLLLRTMRRSPQRDVPLQRAQLSCRVAARLLRLQQREQGLGLQRWIALQLSDDPGPIGGKRIGPCPMRAGALKLAGHAPGVLVFPGRAFAPVRAAARTWLRPLRRSSIYSRTSASVFMAFLSIQRTPSSVHEEQVATLVTGIFS